MYIAESLAHAPQHSQGFNVVLSTLATTYPSLRANETYEQLMRDLVTVENELHSRIELHNSKVNYFNAARRKFPANFLGDMSGQFAEAHYLDAAMAPTLLPYTFDEKLLR